MNQSDYLSQDAVGLADLIAGKQVSATEVLEAAIARTEAVNPALNAVTLMLAEAAKAEVANGAPAGPLGGVPFLIKDLGAAVAGVPTSAGSRLMAGVVPAADSAVISAYRRGGLVIFGKTNTPEFGLEPVTEPELLGPARNPWDLTRTPGGSSGGAAAAAAAGIAPAAHASDGGGSIRIPAACCGLFGMKPSRGRVSLAPGDEGWGGFSIQHAVTRSVRDSAVLLDIICQPVGGDPYWLDPPSRPFAQEIGRDPGSLRIAFTTAALNADGLDPECAEAVQATARLCASLDHVVEEAQPPGDFASLANSAGVVVAANIATTLDNEARRRGAPITQGEVEDPTWALYQRGLTIAASTYIQALQSVHAFGRQMARFFETWDVLLLSTLGKPPIPVGALRGDPSDAAGFAERLFAFMPNTQPFNLTGQPAMSVPLCSARSGLPIGMQFVGRPAGEAMLFRLASQLESASPWKDRRPNGVAW